MNIAVIAADGRAGQAFVHEALVAGHSIRAGIRGNNPFIDEPSVVAVQCDATNKEQVTELITGSDAVVSLLGHVKGSPDFVQRDATEAIATAMSVVGLKRFVSLTGTGVWVKGDKNKAFIDFLNNVSRKVGVKRFDDGVAHVKVLEKSELDWTVIRVTLLTNGEPGEFKLVGHGSAKIPTPRREVARAILKVLEDNSFVHQYPVVAKP